MRLFSKLFIVLTLCFAVGPLGAAQTETKTSGSADSFFWGAGVSAASILNGFGSAYTAAGLGGNVHAGLNLDNNWALFLALDGFSFPTNVTGYSATEFSLTPDLKYTIDANGYKPYLFVGAGLNDNIANGVSSSTSAISFVYNGGVGVGFALAQGLDLQIQAEYESVITANGSFAYLPFSAGIEFN